MLSKTFSFMVVVSFMSALLTGNLENVSREFPVSLSDAVTLCLSLCGMMCFWSGLMNVLRDAGALKHISGFIKPLMKLVYGKEAMRGEDYENLSASAAANFLGLGNAALPLGINTVKGFEKGKSGNTASDSTIMFCVLNTVPFQLIPSTLIALRSKHGSANPYDVIPYIWLCSVIITFFAVVTCKIMAKIWRNKG